MKYFLFLTLMFLLAPLSNQSFAQLVPEGVGFWHCIALDGMDNRFVGVMFGTMSVCADFTENSCLEESEDPDSCHIHICSKSPSGVIEELLDDNNNHRNTHKIHQQHQSNN